MRVPGAGGPGVLWGAGLGVRRALAGERGQVGRHRVAPLPAVLDEAEAALEPVELPEQIGHRAAPETEKGVPVVEHPCTALMF